MRMSRAHAAVLRIFIGGNMRTRLANAIFIALGLAGLAAVPAGAQTTSVVNFETNPSLSTAPSIYVAVPAQQTIVTPEATFTGGVVLGFATFFPAIAFASAPNVYGTADFGNNLARSLNIAINPSNNVTEVSFALFNGETFNQGYVINAFNGATQVASQTIASIAPNFNSGYAIVDLVAAGGITSVNIAPTGNPQAWDFLIDTVAFNQSITSVVNAPPPPEVVLPTVTPAPPVHGHRHGKGKGEVELLEINFGDDVNDIRGSVLVVTTPVPEPGEWAMLLAGVALVGTIARRRKSR